MGWNANPSPQFLRCAIPFSQSMYVLQCAESPALNLANWCGHLVVGYKKMFSYDIFKFNLSSCVILPRLLELFHDPYSQLHLDIGRRSLSNAFYCRTSVRLGTISRTLHLLRIQRKHHIDPLPCIFRLVRYTLPGKFEHRKDGRDFLRRKFLKNWMWMMWWTFHPTHEFQSATGAREPCKYCRRRTSRNKVIDGGFPVKLRRLKLPSYLRA